MQPLRFSECELPSGLRLRFAEQGAQDGPSLLLLHGYTDSWFSFSPLLPLLPPGWRSIIPDQRGHGGSDRPETGYSPDELAGDALQLLDALGIHRTVVAGHSMGSFVAQRLAVLAPDRVAGLVLISSGASVRTPPVLEFMTQVETLSDPVDSGFIREFQESCVSVPVEADFMSAVVEQSRKLPARVWKAALRGLIDADVPLTPGQARCPALMIWGDRDTFWVRVDQEELQRLIPQALLHIERGVGHAPHWERPGAVAGRMAAFLESVPLAMRS